MKYKNKNETKYIKRQGGYSSMNQMNQTQPPNHNTSGQLPFAQDAVHYDPVNLTPTASEVAYLWNSYGAEAMAICFLKVWVSESTDPDIHALLQQILDTSTQRVQEITNLLHQIDYPVPTGFGEKDVVAETPKLFSQTFTCLYSRMMQGMVVYHYVAAFQSAYRPDIRSFFFNCLKVSGEIENKATEIALAKGILNKHPGIVRPHHAENVSGSEYFGSFFGVFGQSRPLNAMEITHLYTLMEIGELGRTLALGYAQVVQSPKIKAYLLKQKEITDQGLKSLSKILMSEDVPVPSLTTILVTDTTEPALSDKLILSHTTAVTAYMISTFGAALAAMSRKDLVAALSKFLADALLLAKEGASLLIAEGWLEQLPLTADRKALTH